MPFDFNGHLIKETEVVGIGPLKAVYDLTSAEYTLYGSTRLRYVVHLRNHSITIEDGPFFLSVAAEDLKPNEEGSIGGQKEYMAFMDEYEKVKQKIVRELGRDIPY